MAPSGKKIPTRGSCPHVGSFFSYAFALDAFRSSLVRQKCSSTGMKRKQVKAAVNPPL